MISFSLVLVYIHVPRMFLVLVSMFVIVVIDILSCIVCSCQLLAHVTVQYLLPLITLVCLNVSRLRRSFSILCSLCNVLVCILVRYFPSHEELQALCSVTK